MLTENQSGLGLSALVEKLERTLVSVEPSPIFVDSLGRRLLATARRKDIQMAKRHRWGILIGAALGSIVSVAGLIAYLLRSRARPGMLHKVNNPPIDVPNRMAQISMTND